LRKNESVLAEAVKARRQTVLTQPEHMPPGVDANQMQGFLRYLVSLSHLQDVHFLWRPFLRDPDDDMVLECAVASGSRFIGTHNTKDFRRAPKLGVQTMTPGVFFDRCLATSCPEQVSGALVIAAVF
jgi:hypothetical protein